jgi:hypothetical protein
MTDELDDYLKDELDEPSGEEDKQESDAASDKSEKSESDDNSKRIRDLQSKADKATAEANKLRARLEKAEADKAAKVNEDPNVPDEVREWLGIAKERAQQTLYEDDVRFKEYNVPPEFIKGSTPSEMKENAKALQSLVSEIEGSVRNKVLVEHGFSPEPATSERQPAKNWATMSSEEFRKEREKATGLR